MDKLPVATLFMLVSVDGKISTGSTDERDFDKDLPNIKGVKEGLQQYYKLEKQTDWYSFNTGRVMAKVGWNEEKAEIKKVEVRFVIVDNKPHLTERGVKNLLRFTEKLFIVTTNAQHPVYSIEDDNLEIISYENSIDFVDLFRRLKSSGAERMTIQSGGEMNAQLMRSGLIDFVSLVVAPVMVGGRDTAALLGGKSLETAGDLALLRPLELVAADPLGHSYLHLQYKCLKISIVQNWLVRPRSRRNERPILRIFVGGFQGAVAGVALEGQLDEFRDKLCVWQAAGFPQFGVHADFGEAGDGVDFVDEQLAVGRCKHVHAAHAFAAKHLECPHGQVACPLADIVRNFGGYL